MIYYIFSLLLVVSTCWMLRVLDRQHYQQLTAQALIAQVKYEYLVQGAAAYARAYCAEHKASFLVKMPYRCGDTQVVLTLKSTSQSTVIITVVGDSIRHTQEIAI